MLFAGVAWSSIPRGTRWLEDSDRARVRGHQREVSVRESNVIHSTPSRVVAQLEGELTPVIETLSCAPEPSVRVKVLVKVP